MKLTWAFLVLFVCSYAESHQLGFLKPKVSAEPEPATHKTGVLGKLFGKKDDEEAAAAGGTEVVHHEGIAKSAVKTVEAVGKGVLKTVQPVAKLAENTLEAAAGVATGLIDTVAPVGSFVTNTLDTTVGYVDGVLKIIPLGGIVSADLKLKAGIITGAIGSVLGKDTVSKVVPPTGPGEKEECAPGYYWRDYVGEVPKDAALTVSADGSLILIGQALHKGPNGGKIIPGTVYPHEGKHMKYALDDKMWSVNENVKIFCTQHTEGLLWLEIPSIDVFASLNKTELVVGGYEESDVYIGKVQDVDGNVIIGKVTVDAEYGGISFVDDDAPDFATANFEVLTYRQAKGAVVTYVY